MKVLRYDKQYLPFRRLSLPVNIIIGIVLFYCIYHFIFLVNNVCNLSITEVHNVILSAFITPIISYYIGNYITKDK